LARTEENDMTKAKSETAAVEAQPDTLLEQTTGHPVDRPGCDFGGSTGKTTAGLDLGLGNDSSDGREQRALPGRRVKAKLSKPEWSGPHTK
jgi:hypothetical protein